MRARLDAIPRTASVVIEAHKASIDLVAPLRLLKKLSEEVFDSLDVWQVRADAEMLLLSVSKYRLRVEEIATPGA